MLYIGVDLGTSAVKLPVSYTHLNPVSIIVPCHRVVGSDGSLTGYGGGLDVKVHLLELEGLEVCCGKVCRSHREAKK